MLKSLKYKETSQLILLVMAMMLMLFVFLNIGQALAAQISTEYLLSVCEFDEKGNEKIQNGHVTCQAYIAGVMDYHSLYFPIAQPDVSFCIPKDTGLAVIQKKVVSYIKRNRQHYGFVASPAVILALHESWPCKR